MGFTVAAIVNEPASVLDRFVGWYLAQGADAIWLFFDSPQSPDLKRYSDNPRVRCTACTADFWRDLGVKPEARFTRRQNAVLTAAYQKLTEGWLLNVDADELMYAPGTTLAEWLQHKSAAQTLRIATAEHVHAPSALPCFRLPIDRREVNAVYGDLSDLFRRRLGLIGHADGKSFHRTGMSDIRLRQHWAEDSSGAEVQGERLGAADGIYLLHFMAPDYDQWRAKLEWRLNAHGFPDPIKARLHEIKAQPSDPEPDFRALFEVLHSVSEHRIAQLQAVGGLLVLTEDALNPK